MFTRKEWLLSFFNKKCCDAGQRCCRHRGNNLIGVVTLFKGLKKSQELFEVARTMIPGGVNSPVRAYSKVNLTPPFIDRGEGCKVYDEDGNEYIDYVASWGSLILGHRNREVIEALENCLKKGTSFGAPTVQETEMARLIIDAVPSIESVRMVNSGTEATMSALRLARGYTGRNKIVKMTGCYHGHVDYLLIEAGSGALSFGVPSSSGVPDTITADTFVLPYNSPDVLEEIFAAYGHNIAAVILEPVAGNMGCILPQPGFLKRVRQLTHLYGALLIFDEVMTGFRVAYGGAQERYNVIPDLTCLGKIIGGGLPVGAYGGKKEIMENVAPTGQVYQAGTLSGNPLAMAAGSTMLKILKHPGIYQELEEKTARLIIGLKEAAKDAGVKITINSAGSMFSIFFTEKRVWNYKSAVAIHMDQFIVFFKNMLQNGIYLAPSPFETAFMSLAHKEDDIQRTLEAASKAFKAVASQKQAV